MNPNLTKFRIVHMDLGQRVLTKIGTFKVDDITDEIAERLIATKEDMYFLEKIEKPEPKPGKS